MGLRPWEFRRLTVRQFSQMAKGHADYAQLQAGKDPFARKDTEEDRQRLEDIARERGLL